MTPSMVCPCRSAARYAKVGIPASIFLGDAQDLLDRGLTRLRLGPSVFPDRDHAAFHGVPADLAGRRLAQDETADLLADQEELVDAHPALVARLPTGLAPLAPVQLRAVPIGDADREQIGGIGLMTNPAILADPPHEPLREDAAQDRGEEIGLDTHILETGD